MGLRARILATVLVCFVGCSRSSIETPGEIEIRDRGRGSGAAAGDNGDHTLAGSGAGVAGADHAGGAEFGDVDALRFSEISASLATNCGIRTDGTVYCWGLACGRSKNPDDIECWGRTCRGPAGCRTFGTDAIDLPDVNASAPPPGRFKSLYLTPYSWCAVDATGRATCWGDGYHAEYRHPWPTDLRFSSIASSRLGFCGILEDGTLWCDWPTAYPDKRFLSSKYVSLSSGSPHMCALSVDGEVACWGLQACGFIWSGNDKLCGNLTPPAGPFVQLDTGYFHACAVREGGTVACWGAGATTGACDGYETECGQSDPPDGEFTMVSAGHVHTCGVRRDGGVECWGAGRTEDDCDPASLDRLQCGQANPPPGRFVAVSAGTAHTCALDASGRVTCWGYGSHLGHCGGIWADIFPIECGQAAPP